MHDRIVELEADVKERDKRIKELEELLAEIKTDALYHQNNFLLINKIDEKLTGQVR